MIVNKKDTQLIEKIIAIEPKSGETGSAALWREGALFKSVSSAVGDLIVAAMSPNSGAAFAAPVVAVRAN